MNLLSLSVILPCYNEAGNVERTVRAVNEVCREISSDYEIILVNDGSRDQTGVIADRLASEERVVRVVHHEKNQGYGGAVRSGFRAATKDYVFYTDGDGQFDCREIYLLLPLLDQFDVVTAYRKNRQESFLRKFNGWAWAKLMNKLFSMNYRDIDCAFKILPRKFLVDMQLQSFGALISAEILAKAKRLGLRTAEVGVSHYPRFADQATGGNAGVILRAFKELIYLYDHIRRFPHLKDSLPSVSLSSR